MENQILIAMSLDEFKEEIQRCVFNAMKMFLNPQTMKESELMKYDFNTT